MPRSDKWLVVALGGLIMGTVGNVMGHTGSARVFWLALGLFAIGSLSWDLHGRRRKRLARRQVLLTRLDRLMRDEVKRR
jgi:hypothetical protein